MTRSIYLGYRPFFVLPHLAVMRNLIGQFAVVDRSTDNATRVNVSRNGHALKESSVYSVDVDIVVKRKSTVVQRDLYSCQQQYSSS